jgi:hypothetical protein
MNAERVDASFRDADFSPAEDGCVGVDGAVLLLRKRGGIAEEEGVIGFVGIAMVQ